MISTGEDKERMLGARENEIKRRGDEAEAEKKTTTKTLPKTKKYQEKERLRAEKAATIKKIKKYSIVVMKMAGGFVKFFFEDCLQFLIQGSYLVKFYHDMSKSARYFTMASMSSSLIVSLAGPVSECSKARNMRSRLGEDAKITDESDVHEMRIRMEEQEPMIEDQIIFQGAHYQASVASATQKKTIKKPVVLQKGDPESFLKLDRQHGVFGHRALILSAVIYWAGMLGVPFVFKAKLTCGADIPMSAIMYFFGLATFCTFCELYVMVHIEEGVRFVMDFVERIRDCHNIMFTLSPALSYLARFDTFSDIVFTTLLIDCDAIKWISIKKVVINIPFFDLGTWAFWTLVIGVIGLQALPGLYMLCTQTYLPMGLKLNEFNTLLAIIDENLDDLEEDTSCTEAG